MRAIASSFRNLYRKSLEERTAALDSRTRTELARDVRQLTSAPDVEEELEQVNDSIEQAQLALEDLEERKRFVGMRLETYREKLEQRAQQLRRAEERLRGVGDEDEQEETRPLGGTQTGNPTPQGVNVIREIHQVQDDDVDDDDDASHENKHEETTPCLSWEDLEKQKERLQNGQGALEKVHAVHAEMEQNVLQLQRKIIILERKREQVLTKTRECRDFLVVAAQMQDDDLEEGPFLQSDQLLEEGSEGPFLPSDQHSEGGINATEQSRES
jgi:predicted  nucleic acid-binding Zn-ribbon protein